MRSSAQANTAAVRLRSGVWLAGCGSLLALAAWLTPDPRGYGTDQQLGLPPCGMIMRFGLPCPTCGMSTAFAHAVRGQWVSAFHAQPAGFALALGVMGAAATSAASLWTGRSMAWRRWNVPPRRIITIGILVLLAAWAYKALCMWLP